MVRNDIRNILHANIDFRIKKLIARFTGDEVNCISKIQYHCANMILSEKIGMIDFYIKLRINEGGQK